MPPNGLLGSLGMKHWLREIAKFSKDAANIPLTTMAGIVYNITKLYGLQPWTSIEISS
jgi:hypothetical protein